MPLRINVNVPLTYRTVSRTHRRASELVEINYINRNQLTFLGFLTQIYHSCSQSQIILQCSCSNTNLFTVSLSCVEQPSESIILCLRAALFQENQRFIIFDSGWKSMVTQTQYSHKDSHLYTAEGYPGLNYFSQHIKRSCYTYC